METAAPVWPALSASIAAARGFSHRRSVETYLVKMKRAIIYQDVALSYFFCASYVRSFDILLAWK